VVPCYHQYEQDEEQPAQPPTVPELPHPPGSQQGGERENGAVVVFEELGLEDHPGELGQQAADEVQNALPFPGTQRRQDDQKQQAHGRHGGGEEQPLV